VSAGGPTSSSRQDHPPENRNRAGRRRMRIEGSARGAAGRRLPSLKAGSEVGVDPTGTGRPSGWRRVGGGASCIPGGAGRGVLRPAPRTSRPVGRGRFRGRARPLRNQPGVRSSSVDAGPHSSATRREGTARGAASEAPPRGRRPAEQGFCGLSDADRGSQGKRLLTTRVRSAREGGGTHRATGGGAPERPGSRESPKGRGAHPEDTWLSEAAAVPASVWVCVELAPGPEGSAKTLGAAGGRGSGFREGPGSRTSIAEWGGPGRHAGGQRASLAATSSG